MKKLLAAIILTSGLLISAIGLSACGSSGGETKADANILSIYNTYVAYAEENGVTPLSYEEWLNSIKGDKGDQGVGISSVIIDDNGDLIVTLTNGETINAGRVKEVHPHEIIEQEVIEREPTCTQTGLKYVYCDTCGELIRTEIVNKLQHDYENIITQPTCTEQGYTTHTCKDCGHVETDTYTEIIPHTYVDTVTQPTCTEQGYTTHTCKYCGHSYKDNYTTADTTEHNYIEKGEIYGNCALSMKQDYVCTRCQHEKAETITAQAPDVHNHLEIGDTCEYCGWSVYTKNGDSVLMKNTEDKLSAEFYGTETYNFGRKQYIVSVYIADSVTSIGEQAFSGCSGLTSITIGGSVTSIGRAAFYGCSNLTSITIPDSVTSIEYQAFFDCRSLTSVNIPDSVTSIGNGAFASCSHLTSINIPDSVTRIGSDAFYSCDSLTSINIPDSVTSIGSVAFKYCYSLTSITIPDSVTSIGSEAFFWCSSLTSIIFNGTKAQWSAISKGDDWDYGIPLTCKVHCTDGDTNL